MTDKRKDLLLYLTLVVGAVIIITAYIFIYLSQTNNDYLYFSKVKMTTEYNSKKTLADLGLNTNIDIGDLKISCKRAKYSDGYILFDKAGDSVITVEHNKLKASVQVDVSFDNISEYLNIFANVSNENVAINEETVVDLYLPSTDSDLAERDGYVNSFEVCVSYLLKEDNYQIIVSDNLSVVGDIIYAQKLGVGQVYLEFANYGKSFTFDVVVNEIAVQDIACGYTFDTLYVDKGMFDMAVNVLPTYATNKNLDIAVSGTSVVFTGSGFVGVDFGESYVTFTKGNVSLVIKVVVCEQPDDIKVTIVSDFIYGSKGICSVGLYKDLELIDGDYYLEFYLGNELVSGETLVENIEIKHNIFSLNVISEESFVIRVVSKQNISLTFDISVNN